jgi:hypothetical protein
MALKAGKDRAMEARRRQAGRLGDYEADRRKVIDAILALPRRSSPGPFALDSGRPCR